MALWTKKLEWSPDADAAEPVWNAMGNLHLDSDHTPEAAAEETSAGTELYAGTDDVYEISCYDHTQYDDLRTKQLADEKVDLRFTDARGDAEEEKGFSVIVTDPRTFQARQRKVFTARFKRTFI